MASDVIGFPHNAAAATLYALIRNADGQIWETVGPSFEAYSTANLANYDLALTEQGTASQFYTFTFPSAVTAGVFSIAVYLQAGGAPAEGDISVAEGEIEWTGSVIVAQTGDAFAKAVLILADLPNIPTKNVALSNFSFLMVDSTDNVSPKTGLTVTGTISKDGAAFSSLTNSVAEIANGIYKVDITADEMNANVVVLRFAASGGDDRFITMLTQST